MAPASDPTRRRARTRRTRSGVLAALVATALVVGSGLGSEVGAQSIDDLRSRASKLAAELDRMEMRASELNEQYLRTTEELEAARRRIEENRAEVEAAEKGLGDAQAQARRYAVRAYIGAGRRTATIGANDANEAISSQVLLETLQGDQLQVAEELRAARLDLQDRTVELERAEAELDARRARQQELRAEMQRNVDRQEALLAGANQELQAAIRAEQERQAREAERRAREAAEAQARAAAQARQQAAARAQATAATRRAAAPAVSGRRSAAPAPAPAAPSIPISAPNGGAAAAIAAAQSVLGTPYRYGGNNPSTGFDCSGLTSWAWARAGVSIPRTSGAQYAGTQRVPLDQLQPGDLVFFGRPIHHVGLYIGGGMMIHSPHTGDVVKVAPIYRGFGSPVGAGRVR